MFMLVFLFLCNRVLEPDYAYYPESSYKLNALIGSIMLKIYTRSLIRKFK